MSVKTDTNQEFYTKIHKLARQKRFPLRVMLELTYRCNFHCPHCYIPVSFREESERRELKTEEIFHILNQLKQIGCLYLGFTGGEPLIREDFFDILWYAKSRGFETIIYTNGSLIDKGAADELKRLRPSKVDITINSLKKERFERITQTPQSYQRVLKGIELLYKKNLPLGFKSCLLKENEGEVGDIKKFAGAHNGFHRLDTMLMPGLDGSKTPYSCRGTTKKARLLSFKYDEADGYGEADNCEEADFSRKVNPALSKLSAAGSRKGGANPVRKNSTVTNGAFSNGVNPPQKRNRVFDCGVGLDNLVINPYGGLKMCICIDYPKYNILKSSLAECWRRLKELVDSIEVNQDFRCDECQLRPYCKWCPARAWLNDGTFTSCDPESRRMAEHCRRIARAEEIGLSHPCKGRGLQKEAVRSREALRIRW